jgi:DNA topoisomerase-1
MKTLLIVESPTKAKTIGKYLGSDYQVLATVGHLRDLPKSKMGVDIDHDFEVTYVIDPEKKKVVNELTKAAKSAERILLATDPDREGEAISWHVNWILGEQETTSNSKSRKLKVESKNIKRITFHEITKEAVENALKEARGIDMDLVNAQQGRRVLDRVVGYTLSPVLWKKVRRGLSAGRVQSVAVRLIVEREKEIRGFNTDKYARIYADLGKFKAELTKVGQKKVAVSNKLKLFDGDYSYSTTIFKSRAEAEKYISGLLKEFKVERLVEKEISRSPLPPFTTSKLQQAAARKMGWSGKQTMRIAQRLYEQGLITYHRTDSVSLADKAVADFRQYIGKNLGESYLAKEIRRFRNTSKNAQEAHEAIRPTQVNVRKLEGDSKEMKLYEMIWKRAVATQAAPARLKKTQVWLVNKDGLFEADGVQMVFEGFLKLTGEEFEDQVLPEMKEGDTIKAKKITAEELETNPPPRYSEASLVSSLEKQGIGRPSTYAPIISTIQLRQYVEKDEGKFKPTALGTAVSEYLVKNFEKIMSLPFTAEMEEDLDEVALGKLEWKKMMKNFWESFDKEVKKAEKESERVKVEAEKLGQKCPECEEGELVIRVGRFGKFVSCNRFPECKYTAPYKEMAGFKCPECGGEGVIRKTKKGRKFYGCGNYPKCKWAGWKKP